MDIKISVLARELGRAEQLASLLSREGIQCHARLLHAQAATDLPFENVDVVIADLEGTPINADEADFFDRVRGGLHLPVIALISESDLASSDLFSKLDDFILQPVRIGELIARIHLVLQRTDSEGNDSRIRFGDLSIDTEGCQVFLDRKAIDLTFKEYELFTVLARNPGKLFTREALLNQVWGYEYYGGERTVDVHIRRLRSKLEMGGLSLIETVRGAGYRFKADAEDIAGG